MITMMGITFLLRLVVGLGAAAVGSTAPRWLSPSLLPPLHAHRRPALVLPPPVAPPRDRVRDLHTSLRRQTPHARHGGAACTTLAPVPLGAFCNLTATLCTTDGGKHYTGNATATGNLTATVVAVQAGTLFSTPQVAEGDAFYRIMLGMSPTAAPLAVQPCGCSVDVNPFYAGGNCSLAPRFCVYFNSTASLLDGTGALYRAKVFRDATPGVVGVSPGFDEPNKGVPGDVPAVVGLAAADYKRKVPRYSAECPAFPIVMVPGYPSCTVQYTMKDSPPPAGHPLCSRSTNGWETLYPPSPKSFLQPQACYDSTLGLTFDNATGTFSPARAGLQTRVQGFGGFEAFPSFDGVTSFFEQGGWTIGKTLFGAPFDWRYPSVSQGQLFARMKQLVENVSVASALF